MTNGWINTCVPQAVYPSNMLYSAVHFVLFDARVGKLNYTWILVFRHIKWLNLVEWIFHLNPIIDFEYEGIAS